MDDIRQLRKEDLEAAQRLSEFAFQYELTDAEREERIAAAKPEQQWGYFTDGELAAKMTVMPLHTWLHGRPFALGGVAGVATWPEYRRKGMVAQLLVHSLARMRETGQTLSFLYPFAFAFYRKYGWETYAEYKKYELDNGKLPVYEAQKGYVRRTEDWQLLNAVYEPYAARYNGAIAREEEWWQRRIFGGKKGISAVYYNTGGAPRGYVRYAVKDNMMKVHELIHLDEEAKRGLWRFIANHDSMFRKLELTAPSDDDLPFQLADPRIKQEIVPYFMARVVDAESLLRQYPFGPAAGGGRLRLALRDECAPWNDGAFAVAFGASGAASVSRDNDVAAATAPVPQAACDIGAFGAMLLGYQRPSTLRQTGRLAADDAATALLEAAIPRRTTYLLDFF